MSEFPALELGLMSGDGAGIHGLCAFPGFHINFVDPGFHHFVDPGSHQILDSRKFIKNTVFHHLADFLDSWVFL